MNPGSRLMFIAGEDSGDQHAARVIREVRLLMPGVEIFGFGGVRMEAAGMKLEENLAQKFPIMGVTQVIRNYGKIRDLLRRAEEMLDARKPDALVLIDYPGFNLRIARAAKRRGIPVIYYIAPQIWAWHKSRLKIIAENVTKMLVILPFEKEIYTRAGVPARYVGHPLCDNEEPIISRTEILRSAGIAPDLKIIGLLPGSRRSEVVRHLPAMLGAASILKEEMPGVDFVLPRAATVPSALISKYTARWPGLKVHVFETNLKSVRAAMDFAVCKSGTSTLELALLGVPMIIIYKMSAISALIARRLLTIKWIGLVNIVANDTVSSELWQEVATPRGIANETIRIMQDPHALSTMKRKLGEVAEQLGAGGASKRVAEEIAAVVNASK